MHRNASYVSNPEKLTGLLGTIKTHLEAAAANQVLVHMRMEDSREGAGCLLCSGILMHNGFYPLCPLSY